MWGLKSQFLHMEQIDMLPEEDQLYDPLDTVIADS